MTDIVERLAQWGECDLGATDVAEAAKAEITWLRRRVEWHAHALHSCHDECDRPSCVKFRNIESDVDRLRAALDKMQRSRDRYRQAWETEKARAALEGHHDAATRLLTD